MKKGILLVNIGTPNSPSVKDVKKYLKRFLNDPYVIKLPGILRHPLVNGIIVPFRAKASAERYQQLWTKEGSPLFVHLTNLAHKLQVKLNEDYKVYAAMRHGEPNLNDTIAQIKQDGIKELIVMPLFPHYTCSTTKSIIDQIKKLTNDWNDVHIGYIDEFFSHPLFIDAVCEKINGYRLDHYDHVLFSYHSLPLNHVKRSVRGGIDYDEACFETSHLLAEKLELKKEDYSTAFQSRFSKRWLTPYTNERLEELVQEGKKNILIVCPSFVADCLETTIEIGQEYRELFDECGGEHLQLVECVNDSDLWVDAVGHITTNS